MGISQHRFRRKFFRSLLSNHGQRVQETRWWRTQKIVSGLAEKYNAPYIDYSKNKHFTTSDFRDNDHLNQKGAFLFSRMLNTGICQEKAKIFNSPEVSNN